MSKVQHKFRMEAELGTLDSQLERATLVQAARAHRLQTEGKRVALDPGDNAKGSDMKLSVIADERAEDSNDNCMGSVSKKVEQHLTPKLDFSHDGTEVSTWTVDVRFSVHRVVNRVQNCRCHRHWEARPGSSFVLRTNMVVPICEGMRHASLNAWCESNSDLA